MRRCILFVIASLVLPVFASVSASPAGAEPSPTPPPSDAQASRNGLPAEPSPDPSRAKASRAKITVPDLDEIPSELSAPVRRLLSDMKSKDLGRKAAAKVALDMVVDRSGVAKRYRLGPDVTEADLLALGAVVGPETIMPGSAERRSPTSGALDCVAMDPDGRHLCSYHGTSATVIYEQEQLSSSESEDADSDGIPDYIETWASMADRSWDYYENDLGMIPVGDRVNIDLTADLDSLCASWPNSFIYCGGQFNKESLDWFVSHEVFHQFQWHYFPSALLVTPVLWVISLLNINPWMESTANWAAAHFVDDILEQRPSVTGGEAQFISAFFSSVNEGIVSRGAGAGATISGPRAYGAMPVVEFFTQQTSDDFVKRSFEALNPIFLDGYSQINDALVTYDYSLDQWLTGLWLSMYTMCDPGASSEWWRLGGELVNGWCGAADMQETNPGWPTARPIHQTELMSLNSAGHHDFSLSKSGAAFIDFALQVAGNSQGTVLALEFESGQVEAGDEWAVLAWKDTPGGEVCQTEWADYPASAADKLAFRILIPNDCTYATLLLVNVRSTDGILSTEVVAPVSWQLFSAGGTITNGTLTLGVTPDGALGLGEPPIYVCRTADRTSARYTAEDSPGPGLIDNATGFDAIRDSWHLPCGNPDLAEGWSVANPNRTIDGAAVVWSRPVIASQERYLGKIGSFTHTTSEATSVIPLEEDYQLIHHWHPTSASNKVYQLDVTVQPTDGYQAQPLIYRRVVPLEMDGANLSEMAPDYVSLVRGAGDGVADATTTLFWDWAEDPWPGYIDDPRVALPHYAFADISDWRTSIARGLAVDVAIGSGTRTDPNAPDFSMFYGITGSAGEAHSILNSLDVTTSVVAEISTVDGDRTVLIGFKDTP